jgi:hypothetical protein
LQDAGADLFLTRSDYELWSPADQAGVAPSGRVGAAEPLYGLNRMNKDSDSGRVAGGDGAS